MGVRVVFGGTALQTETGQTLLEAARAAGLYIPALCAHPDLPPLNATSPAAAIYHGTSWIEHDAGADGPLDCGLCIVQVEGEGEVAACVTPVRDGMVVATTSPVLDRLRSERLSRILAHHPHACLTCAQREGCTREPCSMGVPVAERCCSLLGHCELQAVADYIGIDPATLRYVPEGPARITGEPLFDRDPALCVACGRCVRACHRRAVTALGWVRDAAGRRWVGPLAPTLVEAGCRLCGSCVEVCPTGALMDRALKPGNRVDALVPCRAACPAGTDVPRYVRLVAEGRLAEAAAVVAERAPLVEALGHVCFHPCETVCRRNDVNAAPISICRVKREAGAASDAGWTALLPAPRPHTGRSVAVVGGGPAGLTAAFLLRLLGHSVTVFEATDRLGGMLAHGIPPFRVPREVVQRETAALSAGFALRTNTVVGCNGLSVERLRESYDAVIAATGAVLGVRLGVEGESLPGVRAGLDLLADIAQAKLSAATYANQIVLVVGGGNVAVDCARSALRLGAARVDLVCLEQPQEMPAYAHEIRAARDEGVQLHHGWGIRALSGNGRLSASVLERCTRVFDSEGRFAPVFDEAVTRVLPADAAIVAIGQRQDRSILPTSLDGIFLAGDFATGPRSVVEAIASGREAGLSVDRYLGGPGELDLRIGPSGAPTSLGRVEGFASLPRLEPEWGAGAMPRRFTDVEPGLGPDVARREADRCLRCDLRFEFRTPVRPPSRLARLPFATDSLEQVPQAEGVLRFYDAAGEIVAILGVPDLRRELAARLGRGRAATFDLEVCSMFTQRQNELLSRFVEVHGRMPRGLSEEDNLDDLF